MLMNTFNRTFLFPIASVLSYAERVDVSMPAATKTRVSSWASGFRTRFLEESSLLISENASVAG
jgi:hypothetical protein